MNQRLQEEDIKNLFPGEINFEPEKREEEKIPKIPPKPWQIGLRFVIIFVVVFALSYGAINFSALNKKFSYFFNTKIQGQDFSQAIPIPSPIQSFDPATPAKLIVPKIGADAPISWNVPEAQIPDKLLEGIAHFQGTALPGQKGNIFLIGHSSYYSWSSSPYKDVFALLEKVETGDKIYIQYTGHTYTFQVTSTEVVSPDQVSVMDQGEFYNLTLMTCVPVGTNLNRLIVKAVQVS